jgi:hypothetical protein
VIRDYFGAVLTGFSEKGLVAAAKTAVGEPVALKGAYEYHGNEGGTFAKGSDAWWAQQAAKNGALPGYLKVVTSMGRIRSRMMEDLKDILPRDKYIELTRKEASQTFRDKTLDPIRKGVKLFSLGMNASTKAVGLKYAGQLLRAAAEIGEIATRANYYKVMVESGMSPERAGDAARNLIDFNKKGTATNYVAAFFPFFNPNVQGPAKLADMMASHDPAVRKRSIGAFAGMAAAGFAWGMFTAAIGGDGDKDGIPDTDQIPEFDTQRNMILPSIANLAILKLPLPQTWSAPFYAGFIASRLVRKTIRPKEAISTVLSAFVDAVSPSNSPYGVLQPFVDVATNHRSFGGGSVGPRKFNEAIPDSQLAWKNTSSASKFVAQGLNRLTGGDSMNSGYLDWSPAKLDYLARAETGGIGKFFTNTADTVESISKGEMPKLSRIPIVGRFMVDTDNLERQRYYEQARELDDIKYRRNRAEKETMAKAIQQKYPKADVSSLDLRKMRDAFEEAGASLSPELRKQWFDSLESIDAQKLAAKPAFDAAEKEMDALKLMPDGPAKEAKKREIYLRTNRAYQKAVDLRR